MSTRSRNQNCFEQCDTFMTTQIVKIWDQYEVISRMNDYVSIWFPGLKKRWENKKPGEEPGEPGLDSGLGLNLDPLIRYVVPKNSECPPSDRFRLLRGRDLTFFLLMLMKFVKHTWELKLVQSIATCYPDLTITKILSHSLYPFCLFYNLMHLLKNIIDIMSYFKS